MRNRGAGRGWRTLSRFALIGVIGGGTAACSSDASRLGDPFTNPFTSLTGEPSATGSLADETDTAPPPAIRTPRVQTGDLGAPSAVMSPRPAPSRLAESAPIASAVAGMNPDAGRMASPRIAPVAPAPKLQFGAAPKLIDKKAAEAEARKLAEAKKLAEAEARKQAEIEARKEVEARKLAEVKKAADLKAAEAKKLAEAAEARKLADAKKASEALEAKKLAEAKAVEAKKAAEAAEAKRLAETKKAAEAKKLADAEAKKAQVKTASKDAAKPDPAAERKAEAARKAEAEAKLAKAEAAKEATKKVAEAKAAEAAAKDAAKKAADAKAAEGAAAKLAAKSAPKDTAKETKVAEREPEPAPAPTPVKVASADPVGSVTASDANESFRWPAKGRVINGYGSSGNEGINIAVPEGTPVKAAEDGTVAYAGSDVKGYGKLVLVRHNNGYVSAYAHNGELDVRPGDKVKRGQTIAKSGATGNVTSPQLHFEIRKGATPVDPIPHLASN